MNCTGVTRIIIHTPHVNHGSASIGAHVSSVAPAASPMNTATREIASTRTPAIAIVTRRFMLRSSSSGASNVRWQPLLQK